MTLRKFSLASLLVLVTCVGQSQAQAGGPRGSVGEVVSGLDGVERRLEQMRRKEHSLRRLLDRDGGELEQLETQVRVRGRAYYRLSRGAPRGDLFEHAVRVERLRTALLRDLSRVEALRSQRRSTDRRIALLRERRVPLEVEQAAAGHARNALLAAQERERAFKLAFSNSSGSMDHTAVYSAAADLDVQDQSFSTMRGRLPFPLSGRTEVEQVRRPYADGQGLVMHGTLGAPARSVFGGRVAFADEYPDYGRTVILDHGDGYFTVTAGLSSLDVRAGEDIPAGTRLGAPGTNGGAAEVYFEVRRHSETLEPGQWFGI